MNTRSRKYQLTINNPSEHGFTHERIKNSLKQLSLIYWCLCDETGEEGTYHTHVYLASDNAISFQTIQKLFYGAHIEPAKGSHIENRNYIRKEGKWAETEKHTTNHTDTFEENGLIPVENKKETVNEKIYEMIVDGANNADIIKAIPSSISRIKTFDTVRQTILEEKYKNTRRELTVTYLYGSTGTGKTRFVLDKFGYSNVFRIMNYEHPFDNYKGQDIIFFDEFRSSLPISDMLCYLDCYPVELPCRYTNKIACYTKVYIASNIPLSAQYPNIQKDEIKTYEAFLRRVTEEMELLKESEELPF